LHVPILGRVQAGALTTAIEEPEGYVPISRKHELGKLFALRVRGESMTGAGILPGDIAIVHRQPTADSGDIVVALVGDEATVKRLHLNRKRVELHAENPDFPPIIPPPREVLILGKVIEIRRYLE
jgi:repressor LexA